jgi:hypothetical protein
MDAMRLADVQRFAVDARVVLATLEALQRYGSEGLEGLVLWLGSVDGAVAHVSHAVVPEQNPIRSESGVGYFVEGTTLFSLNQALAKTGLRLIAQVHSHPTAAYHSDVDDRYAIVTAEGGLSLVVPNFGRAPLDPSLWAVYRLKKGTWSELDNEEMTSLITMIGETA